VDWNVVFNQVLTQIGTAATVVGVVGFLGKLAVDHLFKAHLESLKAELRHKNDKELLEVKNKFELDLLNEKSTADKGIILFQHSLESGAASDERIRRELVAWANPIQDAVKGLNSRLHNILDPKEQGYLALDPKTAKDDPNWSIDHEYFLTSTLYYFGQYFAWIRMLEEELNFEIFRSHDQKGEFFRHVILVSKALGDYHSSSPYAGTGNDTQVFRLQQRAIGEALAIREGKRRACMPYNVFATRKRDTADTMVLPFLAPLIHLVDCLKPGERRYARLEAVWTALRGLEQNCQQLLDMPVV
jgi:hypothetical protein